MEEWIQIRDLSRKGVSVSEIARQTGHDRKTVRKVLNEPAPKVQRTYSQPRPSKLDPFREYLQQRIDEGCINGAVLLDEICRLGYTGKISILRAFLTPIRQELVRKQEVTERFETAPGKQGQVDWAEFGKIWVPAEERWRKLSAFIFTLGYSRALFLVFTTACDMEHFLECHLSAFTALGIPEQLLYDNLKTAILGRRPDGTPILPSRFHDFALYYGFTPKFCKPYRARTKGKTERSISYVRQNFWVRVAHQVAEGQLTLDELNERAREWVSEVANVRVHGTHGEVVLKRYAEEAPLLGKVTARPRFDTSYRTIRRVSRDGRISYRGQLSQVPLSHALTEVEVIETLDGVVTMRTRDGQVLPLERVTGREATPTTRLSPATTTCGRDDATEWLGYRHAPVVETRDLMVYEEVAHGASAG